MKTQKVDVFGSSMAYVESGEGKPIVFLHGNPTSKYLWRNVMPHVESLGRCIAPDLIGMGESSKLPNSGPYRYRFFEHYRYLREFLYQIDATSEVVFVIHDWGSALGFHWANEHQSAVRGLCFMEAIVRPMSWEEWPEAATRIFQGFRSPDGEAMVLDRNLFVERVLPNSVVRNLGDDVLNEYRKPYIDAGEDRRPTLSWPREIPLGGEPAAVVEAVASYGEWLSTSDLPKLFINATPGAVLIGKQREYCRSWPNLKEVNVTGDHFVPEDAPDEIGQALREWLTKVAH